MSWHIVNVATLCQNEDLSVIAAFQCRNIMSKCKCMRYKQNVKVQNVNVCVISRMSKYKCKCMCYKQNVKVQNVNYMMSRCRRKCYSGI